MARSQSAAVVLVDQLRCGPRSSLVDFQKVATDPVAMRSAHPPAAC